MRSALRCCLQAPERLLLTSGTILKAIEALTRPDGAEVEAEPVPSGFKSGLMDIIQTILKTARVPKKFSIQTFNPEGSHLSLF